MQPHSWFGLLFVVIGGAVFYGLVVLIQSVMAGGLDGSYLLPALIAALVLALWRKYR